MQAPTYMQPHACLCTMTGVLSHFQGCKLHPAMQCNAMQCSAVQCSAGRLSTAVVTFNKHCSTLAALRLNIAAPLKPLALRSHATTCMLALLSSRQAITAHHVKPAEQCSVQVHLPVGCPNDHRTLAGCFKPIHFPQQHTEQAPAGFVHVPALTAACQRIQLILQTNSMRKLVIQVWKGQSRSMCHQC
jgi:hypothetical protein